MNLTELTIKGISYSQTQTGAYALVLSEMYGSRTLPIIIGAFEAQSIAIALEDLIRPPRPLTHDLFKTFADRFSINIKQIIIHKLVDGVFFSNLICEQNGIEEVIDARTSDAIALAIRFQAPIFTYESILDKAGIHLKIEEDPTDEFENNDDDDFNVDIETNGFSHLDINELENLLEAMVSEENYEVASEIQEEINKRKNNQK